MNIDLMFLVTKFATNSFQLSDRNDIQCNTIKWILFLVNILLSPFCRCSPNTLNCQRTPCFASTGFRNCNIHLTVCQERLQKWKVIDVEGAAKGIGEVYQVLTKKMHNSRRSFSSRIVRENCDDDSNRNIQILNVYYYYLYYNSFI